MKRIAVIGIILESPSQYQAALNAIISDYKHLVKGRMGLPYDDIDLSVISLTVIGQMDEINALTGKLGKIPAATVKAAVSPRHLEEV